MTITAMLLSSAVLFAACTRNSPEPQGENTIDYDFPTDLAYNEAFPSRTYLKIISAESWEITVTDPQTGEATAWITADPAAGEGSKIVTMSSEAPNYGFGRTAGIRISFETSSETITVTQEGFKRSADQIPGWLELPEVVQEENSYFITHSCTLNQETVRNYSMLYDSEYMGSYWVAYPLHASYVGDSGRNDLWAFDPSIPENLQFRYHNLAFGSNYYDRGHQVPSADRTATVEMNIQTFYSTNITPQWYYFNQQKWENIENWFRTQHAQQDTVWIVTGAVYRTLGGSETVETLTNSNNTAEKRGREFRVSIPNYYYKIGLKAKGNSYTAIGFWYENARPDNNTVNYQDAKSIRYIEDLTGINFFVNLPAAVREEVENLTVEQMRADWNL